MQALAHAWTTNTVLYLEYTTSLPNLLRVNQKQWPFIDDQATASAFSSMVDRYQPLLSVLRKENCTAARLGYAPTSYNTLNIFVTPPPIITASGCETTSSSNKWLAFATDADRDLGFLAFAGRWGYLWWLTYGDDFDVTKGVLTTFPAGVTELENSRAFPELLMLSAELQKELPKHLRWKLNAGKRIGRYDLRGCRNITDEADLVLAKVWDVEFAYEAAGNLRDRMTFGQND